MHPDNQTRILQQDMARHQIGKTPGPLFWMERVQQGAGRRQHCLGLFFVFCCGHRHVKRHVRGAVGVQVASHRSECGIRRFAPGVQTQLPFHAQSMQPRRFNPVARFAGKQTEVVQRPRQRFLSGRRDRGCCCTHF